MNSVSLVIITNGLSYLLITLRFRCELDYQVRITTPGKGSVSPAPKAASLSHGSYRTDLSAKRHFIHYTPLALTECRCTGDSFSSPFRPRTYP